jgi:hypothetical protein
MAHTGRPSTPAAAAASRHLHAHDAAKKHADMMTELEQALKALCSGEDGHARAACSRETYEKYSKPFHD